MGGESTPVDFPNIFFDRVPQSVAKVRNKEQYSARAFSLEMRSENTRLPICTAAVHIGRRAFSVSNEKARALTLVMAGNYAVIQLRAYIRCCKL